MQLNIFKGIFLSFSVLFRFQKVKALESLLVIQLI
jgi:hypothetical protein